MKTKLFIGISALIVILAFQNCGQPGSVQLTSDGVAPQKLSANAVPQQDPPLVVDVVAAVADSKTPAPAAVGSSPAPAPASAPVPKSGEMSADDGVVIPAVINNVEEVLDDNSCGEDKKKVLVCHFPPGNPAAMHTICISRHALNAHMNHGHSEPEHQDHIGACR